MQNKKNFGLFKVLNEVLELVPQLLKQWKVFVCYAGVFTILSAVLGQWPHSCFKSSFWCISWSEKASYLKINLLILYIVLCLFITLFFMYDFYNAAFKNIVFKFKDIYCINKQKLKSSGFIILSLLACFIPSWVAFFILFKPANTDWKIEFIWFVIAFCCMMIPIMAIRLFSFVSIYYKNGKIPPYMQIFKQTIGKSYVGIFLFLLLAWIIILGLKFSYNLNVLSIEYNYLPVALITSFTEYFLRLEYLAVFLLFSRAQDNCLNIDTEPKEGDK